MPKWGLTARQQELEPWGLPAELLRAAKTITNSIESDIYVTRLEQVVIDSAPLQRLRRVRQLGNSHLVYPDATHNRFGHVLGALRVAQDLLDSVFDQHNRPKARADLFDHWSETLDSDEFDRRLAEATVLARLGALLHDLCHVPFGHTIEDDLQLLVRHDANIERFEAFWSQLDAYMHEELALPESEIIIRADLKSELQRLVLSKCDYDEVPSKYPFVEDLVGNTICADLLDYLPRDHTFLGLPIALGHRFREYMYVTGITHDDPEMRQRIVIQVESGGHERSDIITEILKFLRYRYEESERVLNHHAKLAADAMIGKLLAMQRDALWTEAAADLLGDLPEAGRRDVDVLRAWIEQEQPSPRPGAGKFDPADGAELLIQHLDKVAEANLENQLRTRGDDGLLEHIWAQSSSSGGSDGRMDAISSLARNVLDRRLYKPLAASYHADRALKRDAERIWKLWGNKDERRRLEVEAANYIGLEEKWHLVLWIPHPDMKLKLADVLVGLRDDEVTKLGAHSESCQDIYDSHERLWAVSVFGHRSLREDDLKRDVLLAWLRERLKITRWELGPTATKERLIIDAFALEHNISAMTKERLLADVSGKGDEFNTMKAVQDRLGVLYKQLA
jgi:HD superfamily phosphohydrolase